MVVRREKKRRRGERSYHGSHKKWRGKGSRGGRGKGGKWDHKLIQVLKYYPNEIGKVGFEKPKKVLKIINLDEINEMINKGKLDSKNLIDLSSMGYDKLLGRGNISYPIKVKVSKFSEIAKRKIESVGGQIIS